MTNERLFPASAKLSDNELWIAGGGTGSSEIFTDGQGFSPYSTFPDERYTQTLIKASDTKYIMVGDYYEVEDLYVLDTADGIWRLGANNLTEARARCQGGMIRRSDGSTAAVIAGGFDIKSSEIFDPITETLNPGPELPFDIRSAASVQLEDTFLIVGGISEEMDDTLISIIMFDVENNQWQALTPTLGTPRSNMAAILVPSDFVEC